MLRKGNLPVDTRRAQNAMLDHVDIPTEEASDDDAVVVVAPTLEEGDEGMVEEVTVTMRDEDAD